MNTWYQNFKSGNSPAPDTEAVKRRKKRGRSHVGRMEGAYNPPNWSRKLDTRLTPVHRYVLQEATVFHNFCSVRKKADGKWHPIMLTDDKYLGYLGQYGKSQYQNGFTDEEFSDVEFELANLGIRLEKDY